MAKCKKVAFTKADAEIALKRALKIGKYIKRRKEKRIYHCPICNHWHLTSTVGETKKLKPVSLTHHNRWVELLNNDA